MAAAVVVEKASDALKLFVGQIPRILSEAEVRPYFEKIGPVFELSILRDRFSGASKGCAFLTYCTRASALECVKTMHDTSPMPNMLHPLQIKPADSELKPEERKLFVGMIPKTMGDDELRALFSPYGNLEELAILRQPGGESKGCAFVKFGDRAEAQSAIAALHNSATLEGCRSPIVVKFADTDKDKLQKRGPAGFSAPSPFMGFPQQHFPPQQMPFFPQQAPGMFSPAGFPGMDPSQFGMGLGLGGFPGVGGYPFPAQPNLYGGAAMHAAQSAAATMPGGGSRDAGPDGANLFIYHLPVEFNDSALATTFMPFGNILSAKVFVDKNTQQSKCFGFVSYDNAMSANKAVQAMNGFQIGLKRLKVALKRPKTAGFPY